MPRRALLTADQRARLFAIPVEPAEMIRHYLLDGSDIALIRTKRRAVNRLGFAVQICLFRFPGQALAPNAVLPETFLLFVANQLGVDPALFSEYARRDQTRREHAVEIQALLGLRSFRLAEWRAAIEVGAEVAWATDRGEPIVQVMLEQLRGAKVIVPDAPVLERIGLAARARARKRTFIALSEALSEADKSALCRLLIVDRDLGSTPIAWLRNYSESSALSNILDLLERLELVRTFSVGPERARRVHSSRLAQIVDEGAIMTAQHIADLEPLRRTALLVALVIDLETRLADATLAMFERHIGSLFTKAQTRSDRRFQATKREVAMTLALFGRTIAALKKAKSAGANGLSVIEQEIDMKRLDDAVPIIEAVTDVADQDILVTAAERYGVLRRFTPRFLAAFCFRSNTPNDPVLAAVSVLKEFNRDEARAMPKHPPASFLPTKWRKLIFGSGAPDRRLYETAVLATLRDRLKSGEVWIDGSRGYRAFEDYLLPPASPNIASVRLGDQIDPHSYIADRAALLHERLCFVAARAERGDLDGVEIENGKLYIARFKATVPDAAKELSDRLSNLLPRVRITEVLTEVDRWTRFSDCFTHLRTGNPCADKASLLAAVLADGTNLGLSRMADASRGLRYHQLVNVAQWHISEGAYASARAAIVNAHHRHPMASLWGDGTSSSSDGQYFRSGGRAGPSGDVNAKYGIDPGVSLYTHVSDQYDPFHTTALTATTSEAPYVLDGLLHHAHGTDLQITDHYTDTAGATAHVFGLSHLLGYRFAPRIKGLKHRKLYCIEKPGAYPVLEPLIGGVIDTAAIVNQAPELKRLVASIKTGTVPPSVMLRKLSAAGLSHPLSRALHTVGRIEQTIFTLNWLSDPALRQSSHWGLNKGEASNSLRRALFFHRQGEFRDRTFENQSFRASGLTLLTAAIVHWNTVYLDLVVQHLRAQGVDVPDSLLAHVAPLGWEHIALTGDYVWSLAEAPETFRPLRDVRRPFLADAA